MSELPHRFHWWWLILAPVGLTLLAETVFVVIYDRPGGQFVANLLPAFNVFYVVLTLVAVLVVVAGWEAVVHRHDYRRLSRVRGYLELWGVDLAPLVGLIGTCFGGGMGLRQGDVAEALGVAIGSTIYGMSIFGVSIVLSFFVKQQIDALQDPQDATGATV